jgi:RNA polymerase sigma-70 factor, ECF subfamily
MATATALPSFQFNATYIQSLRQGDPRTQEHFVSHFSPILMSKLRRKLRSTEMAYDLRQETFVRVLAILRSKHGVRQPERFEFLVLGVCNNVLREAYRYRNRLVQLAPDFDLTSGAPSPDLCAIAGEAERHIQRLLSRLDPSVRAIVQAAFLEDQDRDEICMRFAISRNYLRVVICRAKKALEACAQNELKGRGELSLRRASRPRRRVFKVLTSLPAAGKIAKPSPLVEFLPAMQPAEIVGRQYCA